MKILIAFFLGIMFSFALADESKQSIDAEHPYMAVAFNADETAIIYIGAFEKYLPVKTNAGDVVFQTMYVQIKAQNGMALGEKFESVVITNCERQIYKMVTVWHKPNQDSPGVSTFQDKNKRQADLEAAFTRQETSNVITNSPIASLVDAACNYIANKEGYKKPAPKPKPREIAI